MRNAIRAGDYDAYVEGHTRLREIEALAGDIARRRALLDRLAAAAPAWADALRSRLQKNYTEKLDITVSFVSRPEKEQDEALAPRVYVTGEVLKPGPYIVKLRTNVMQAIALAGGLGPFAAKKRIQVRRKIKGLDEIYEFNYVAYESGQDMAGNIDLKSGDIVIVPERGLIE